MYLLKLTGRIKYVFVVRTIVAKTEVISTTQLPL